WLVKRSLLVLGLLWGCHGRDVSGPSSAWRRVARGSLSGGDGASAVVLSDTALRSYLPARVLGRAGDPPHGSVTRIGPRALSEVIRTYPGREGDTELKLADARFEPHATEAIRSMADDGEADRSDDGVSKLVLPGAVGYARYDGDERLAQAQVVIAGRFIASATVQQARDAQAAVAALRTVDTLSLSKLAKAEDGSPGRGVGLGAAEVEDRASEGPPN
ncbi:MAG TPA: hypothetical protein VMB50_11115, partial [Myxococcales bacterium]|nr:hypothetical protein [Myxococcales bacterium]